MSVRRRGKGWELSYRDPSGVWKRKMFQGSKAEANAAYMRIMTQIKDGSFFDNSIEGKQAFKSVVKDHETELVAESAVKAQRFRNCSSALLKFFGEKALRQITPGLIEQFRTVRLAGRLNKGQVNKATVNREVGTLKMLLNKAVRLGYLQKSPATYIRKYNVPKGRVRLLDADEKARWFAACADSLMVRDISIFGMQAGLVGKDLAQLRASNADFQRSQIVLTRAKTGVEVSIPMTKDVRAILARRLLGITDPDTFVFRKDDGLPYQGHRTALRRVIRKAGLKDFRPYDFRHQFAADMVWAGVDIYPLAMMMGHADVKTTMIYAKFRQEHQRQEGSKFQEFLDAEAWRVSNATKTAQAQAS